MTSLKTRGVSPKVVADLLVSVVVFVVTYLGLDLDPAGAALLSKACGTLAAYLAGPGNVVRVTEPVA